MSELPSKVLVVDHDASVSNGIENALARQKMNVQKSVDGNSAVYLYGQARFDCALVEQNLEDVPGLVLIQKWRADKDVARRTTGMLLLQSGTLSSGSLALLKELSDIEIVKKPINHPQMLSLLSKSFLHKKRALLYEKVAAESHEKVERDFPGAVAHAKAHLSKIGPRGLDLIVELYIRAQKLEDALALVTGQLAKDPESPRLLNLQSKLQYYLGRYDIALKTMEKLHKMAPDHVDRMRAMADSYVQLGSPDKSLDLFAKLVQYHPEHPDYKFEVIQKLQGAGFPDDAKTLGQRVATPMEIVRYYNNRGVELSKGGETQQALNEYQTALNFFPKFKENYRIYYNMALAYKGRKTRADFEEAKICLEHCLELSPEYEKGVKALEVVVNALGGKKTS